ncbi:shikimate kinase [Thermosynechococcus sp.]|uniref:shikimate kinase n=1 Tax=Thermosynechococcus sp. TaxID=2814275 RepID=UPI0039187FAA
MELQERLGGVNIYLVGMMGAGKTTTGRLLAQRLGYAFVDTDAVIAEFCQRPIREIFAQEGESTFRELEQQVLAQVSSYHHLVVATGGGIVLNPMNWSYLRHGIVVWLSVPLAVLCQRLRHDQERPLLQEQTLEERLGELLETRQHLYAQADLELNITAKDTPETVCDRLWETLPHILKPIEPSC